MATESDVNSLLSSDVQAEDNASAAISRTAATATEQGSIQNSIQQQQAVKSPSSASSFVTDPQFWSDVGHNWEDLNVAGVHGMMHSAARAMDWLAPHIGSEGGYTADVDSSPSLQPSDPTSVASKVGEWLGNVAFAAPLTPGTAGLGLAESMATQGAFWGAVGFATGDDREKDADRGVIGGMLGEVGGASLKAAGTFLKTLWSKGGTEVAIRAAETAPHTMPLETTPWTPDSVANAGTAEPKASGTETIETAPVAPGEAAVAPSSATGEAPTVTPAAEPAAPPVFDPKAFVGNLVADATPEATASLRDAIVSGDLGKIGELQRYMPNLPWDQLAEGGNLQATFHALADHYEGVVQDIGGVKVIPRELQLQFAANQGRDPQVVMDALNNLGQHTDDGGLAARVLAGNHLDIETASQLYDAAQAVSDATVGSTAHIDAVNAFNAALERKVAVQAVMSGAKNELGRSLGALRYMQANRAIQLPDGFGDGKTATEIADALLKKMKGSTGGINLQGTNEGARALKAIGPTDWLLEMARNGLLSNPALHWINAKANVVRMGVSLAEQYIAAGVGTVSKAVGTAVHAAADAAGIEMRPMAQQLSLRAAASHTVGSWNALTDSTVWTDAMDKALHDATVDYSGQPTQVAIKGNIQLTDVPNALKGVNHIQQIVDLANKALDVGGTAIRLPGRALGSVDHINVTVAQRASLTQQAYLRASSMADASDLAGDARASFISDQMKDLLLNPTDGMLVKAQADGSYASMQESAQWHPTFFGLNGTTDGPGFGAGVTNMLNKTKLLKLMVAPFTSRPGNAFRQAIMDYTPMGAAFDKTTQAKLLGGGVDMNLAAARILMGTAAMWEVWNHMDSGRITGSSSYGDLSRMGEIPDYSIKVGDKFYPYKRMEPAGIWLGAVADAYNAVKSRNTTFDTDGTPNSPISRALLAFALASGHMLTEMPAMVGIKRLTDILSTHAGQNLEQHGIGFLGGAASAYVPFSGFNSWLNNNVIDGKRHVPENIWQALCQRIPGMESSIPVERDIFGRPVKALNQYSTTTGTTDPLSAAVAKVSGNVKVDKPMLAAPRDGQQGIPLPEHLANELAQIKGEQQLPALGGKSFPEYASQFVQSPQWLNAGQHGARVAPDGGTYEHMDMLHGLLQHGNDAAWRQLMINHPELRGQMRDAAQQQMAAIQPQ